MVIRESVIVKIQYKRLVIRQLALNDDNELSNDEIHIHHPETIKQLIGALLELTPELVEIRKNHPRDY